FGNVFVGRWDTPYKRTAGPTRVGSQETGIWGSSFIVQGGSTSTLDGSSRAAFLRRQANLISYDSPNFGGFQVMTAYSSINGATGTTVGVTGAKARVMSLAAQYSAGPIYVSGGYERHNEFGGVGGDNDDSGWHVGATYTWGPVRFGGQYTRQKLEASSTTESRVRAWHLGVDWQIVGPHGLRAAYSHVGDIRGSSAGAIGTGIAGSSSTRPNAINGGLTGETGATLWQVRYVYTFSKRTEFNAGYVKLDNDDRAFYALGGVSSPRPGENQDAWGLSVRHTF
ncbi:MAG TPA: porin, partial [Burkholderiales bacterium]|nr:porin [Burkholderiales bacterium]